MRNPNHKRTLKLDISTKKDCQKDDLDDKLMNEYIKSTKTLKTLKSPKPRKMVNDHEANQAAARIDPRILE